MKHTETYTSCLHTHVRFHIYQPLVVLRIKGIIQVHHGLCEHADRYDHFASFLANQGYIVVVSDFVGHGESLIDFEQGYFGEKNGSDGLVKDMFHLYETMRIRDEEAPYYMLGVDIGSLFVRKFISQYGDYVQGAILLETPGNIKHTKLNRSIIRLFKMTKGTRYHSKVLHNNFNRNNNRKAHKMKKMSWYTSDHYQRQIYLDDPMTHFAYTIKGYEDILDTLIEVNSSSSIKSIPQYLPIYMGVGSDDVLSDNSHSLYLKYKKHGIEDLTYEIFEGFRHAILFETDRRAVYQSILQWLNERTYL